MNNFKFIYKITIGFTIVVVIIKILEVLGTIDLTTETGQVVSTITSMVLVAGFFLSRNANVIANRKHNLLTWIITFMLLIYLLVLTLQLLVNFTVPSAISTGALYIAIAVAGIILTFEIPPANSSHDKFQKLLVILIIITTILSYFYINSAKSLSDDDITFEEYTNKMETYQKAYTISLLITVGAFFINPMLRVHYLNSDYSNADEINDILDNADYETTSSVPNPNNVISEKYKTQEVKSTPVITPTPSVMEMPTETVVEELHEKVINPNFNQENVPDAIIPSIAVEEPTQVVNDVATTSEQSAPSNESDSISIENPSTPINQAITPSETIPDSQEQATIPVENTSTLMNQVAMPTTDSVPDTNNPNTQ